MIFLSASIPDPRRDEIYFKTADIIAIRDAVRALATVVIPHSRLLWGGHPAITPLIREVLIRLDEKPSQKVLLYQSLFFVKEFPKENEFFETIIKVEAGSGRDDSLYKMRRKMLFEDRHRFTAGIFIGGMKGVEDEFNLFREFHPYARAFAIASTGGAAKNIYERAGEKDPRLENDYAYLNLFKSLEL